MITTTTIIMMMMMMMRVCAGEDEDDDNHKINIINNNGDCMYDAEFTISIRCRQRRTILWSMIHRCQLA